ncbi:MAG: hypothetical protein FWF09_02100 [Bacteroidales bacterium]|nr:hypothetical protein [Bacteroidales bacterium]
MLVRLYKSASFIQNLVLIVVATVLWVPRFHGIQDVAPEYAQQPLFQFCFGFLQHLPYISVGVALLLLLFAAFFARVSLYFDRLRFSGHNFPILLFVLFSATPHVTFFSPIVLTALMLSMALLFAFRIPETSDNDHFIFFTACMFGIAAIFYLPTVLLLLLFLGIYFLGNFPSKKIWVAVLGFLFPVIWMVAGLYLSSNLSLLIDQWTGHLFGLSLPYPILDIRSFVVLSLLVIVYILIIFRILSRYSERTAIIRRRITISCYLALLLLLSAVFSYNFYEHLSLLSVPMVALISYYYNEDAESQWIDYVLIGCFVMLSVFSFL